MKKYIYCVFVSLIMFSVTSCVKPYDKPEYKEINNSETAFLVPLEDDTAKQTKLDSEELYLKHQINYKKVLITKRWSQTGRWSWQGEWIPTIRLITVDRAPVTREWTADSGTGTDKVNQAIWAESSDSVGFSTGITCTGFVQENDSAKFLYWYPSGSLAKIMDTEIRARIQQVVAETSAKYIMDILRDRKSEIIADVRKDVVPFFAERGITISTIGMFGGFTYENTKIQDAIDSVFIAQQEKSKESALLDAMETKKKRMQEEGTASANQAREVAKGEADATLLRKEAEAQGISLVNESLEKAKGNPLFVQIKALEVESERITKWNGNVPSMIVGGESGGFVPMMNMNDILNKKH